MRFLCFSLLVCSCRLSRLITLRANGVNQLIILAHNALFRAHLSCDRDSGPPASDRRRSGSKDQTMFRRWPRLRLEHWPMWIVANQKLLPATRELSAIVLLDSSPVFFHNFRELKQSEFSAQLNLIIYSVDSVALTMFSFLFYFIRTFYFGCRQKTDSSDRCSADAFFLRPIAISLLLVVRYRRPCSPVSARPPIGCLQCLPLRMIVCVRCS